MTDLPKEFQDLFQTLQEPKELTPDEKFKEELRKIAKMYPKK